MRIGIITPTYDGKHYCHERFMAQIEAIKAKSKHEVYFYGIDNSISPFYNEIQLKVSGVQNKSERMAISLNLGLKAAQNDKCDYIWFLESDIFVRPDSGDVLIERMDKVKCNILGMPYFIGSGHNTRLMDLQGEVFGLYRKSIFTPVEKSFIEANGMIKKSFAAGLGCLMVKAHIFNRVRAFRWSNEVFPDSLFHDDLLNKTIGCYICTDYYCYHENQNWKGLLL